MKNTFRLMVTFIFLVTGCAASGPTTVMETEPSQPGGSVTRNGNSINLLGNAISLGNIDGTSVFKQAGGETFTSFDRPDCSDSVGTETHS